MPGKKRAAPKGVAGKVKEVAFASPFGVSTTVRRKNFNLPQSKIDRARDALGAATDTEAILRALDLAIDVVAFRETADRGLGSLVGKGGFTNYFDPPGVDS